MPNGSAAFAALAHPWPVTFGWSYSVRSLAQRVCRQDTEMMSNPRELAVLLVGPARAYAAWPNRVYQGMATEPDYYIFTFQTDRRPFPWRWEIRRHSRPMGVKPGSGGYQSQSAAEFAGKNALERFLIELSQEERRGR
jgi:hypothetical protein